MWLCVEPMDVLMFRDGKPFTGGDAHYATSVFPPLPTTMQGALRGRILADHGRGLPAVDRLLQDDYGAMRLAGPFPYTRHDGLLLPAPHDALVPDVDNR